MVHVADDEMTHLFSCPLFRVSIPNFSKLNDLLTNEAREWRKSAAGVNISNKGDSWHSPDGLLSRKEAGFQEFSKLVPKYAALYLNRINPKLKLGDFGFEANAWVNINRRGGFNAVHTHGKFHISGCYYVKQPRVKNGQSGMIEFVNTRFDHHIHSTIGGEAFAAKFTIRPNEGDMIIFPSTLLHSVHPNETKEERISIAWNILFKKKTASASIMPKTAIFQTQKPTLKI